MKISKSLLQAILVGVVVGSAATSCEKIQDANETILERTEGSILDPLLPEPQPQTLPGFYNCQACGMG
jgi:hypothetical protein